MSLSVCHQFMSLNIRLKYSASILLRLLNVSGVFILLVQFIMEMINYKKTKTKTKTRPQVTINLINSLFHFNRAEESLNTPPIKSIFEIITQFCNNYQISNFNVLIDLLSHCNMSR